MVKCNISNNQKQFAWADDDEDVRRFFWIRSLELDGSLKLEFLLVTETF